MGKRVNIQYSVGLEDLEMEVVRMIKETGNKLEGYGEDLGHLVGLASDEQSLTLKTLKDLMEFRERIAKVDYMLEDIASIISSYIRYKLEPEEAPAPETPAPDAWDAPAPETLAPDAEPEPLEEHKASMPPNIERVQQLIDNFKSSVQIDEVSD
jgi:hypothetical protein